MPGATRAGGSVRARDLAVGMLMACTSLVANAVVNGDGSLAPRTAGALPEPFTIQDAAAGPHRGGASVVVTAIALASSTRPLTDSGVVVPGTATGHDDDSLGSTDGAVTPSGAVSVEPVENVVAVPPDAPPAFEPVGGISGDELEGPVAPALQPVTEPLAPVVDTISGPVTDAATSVAEATEGTEPALSMLNPPLFA
ncbi:MAG: hypothetical protein LC799_03025 [Actinobacteria bacterium]|nr:hypothetical protein [Actinomycetota bacterium]